MTTMRKSARRTNQHPGSLKPLCYALLLSFATAAQANPTAPTVVHGSVQFNQVGSSLNVTNSPNAIINWQSFSIDAGETTRFIQQSANSAVLNRVVGQNVSSLLGTLESNGKVWLINPSGILIGRDAQINVGGLVASTLDVMDGDFLGGRMNFNGDASALLENQGNITVPIGGGVYLLGGEIENSGIITAPSGEVVLAAGKQIEIGQAGTPNLSVNIKAGEGKALNLGQIATPDGSTNIFASLIEQKGVINAGSAVREGGRILLRASKQVKLDSGSATTVNSTTGSGGDIVIDAGFVALGGTVSADGASGGQITVEASGGLSLAENVSARGTTGEGGSVSYHSGGQTLETSTSHTDVSGKTDGGRIRLAADGGLMSSGNYSALGETGAGGRIDLSGDYMRLFGSEIDASGQIQGGLVRIGGAFQGGKAVADGGAQGVVFLERWGELDSLARSARTFINDSTRIDVSARDDSMQGGTAIVWSDVQTTFLGSVVAPGGAVEISSAGDLRHVNLNNLDLAGGQLLLDPKNIIIGDYAAASGWTWQALMGSGYTGSKNVSLNNLDIGEPRNDQFGNTVTLNDAGDRLAVGAVGDDGFGNDNINAGAVYLFSFTDGDFTGGTLQAILGIGYTGGKNLDVGNVETGAGFGRSVALNASGNRLAVSATSDAETAPGEVYLFSFSDTNFSGGNVESIIGRGYTGGKNLSLPGLENGDSFGTSVSLNAAGDRLAVGAENDGGLNNVASDSGAVYLLSFSDGNFSNPTLQATLGKGYSGGKNFNVSNLETGDYFGVGVALNAAGDRLAVGAPFDQGLNNATGTDTGAVYLFSFADTSFSTPSLLGIVGSGYSGGASLNVASLQSGDYFGWSVDLANNRIAVGAPGDDGFGDHMVNDGTGAAYLFSSTDNNLTGLNQEAVLGFRYSGGKNLNLPNLSDGNEYGDFFGGGVALNANADRLVVGAPGSDDLMGAAYAFTFSDTSFSGGLLASTFANGSIGGKNVNVANLEGSDIFSGDMFGLRVALNANADRLAVGAPGDDGASNAYRDTGAVYLFSFSDSDYNGATLQGIVGKGYSGGKNVDVPNLDNGDRFGFSVALNAAGDRLGVGAPDDDGFGNSGNNFGAVYGFSFTDTSFSGGTLEAIAGKGYSGGKNRNNSLLEPEDNFGWSIAFNAANNRMAIGAPGDDGLDNLDKPDAGAVWLFSFSDSAFSGGALEAVIGAGYSGAFGNSKNLSVSGISDRNSFGNSVSLNAVGDRLAIGAEDDNIGGSAGAVYLYSFTDGNFSGGNLEATLGRGFSGGKNFDVTNAEDGDRLGWSVSLNAAGDRLAVGAPWDNGSFSSDDSYGAVYLFSFSDTLFSGATQQAIVGNGYSGGKNIGLNLSEDGLLLFGSGVSLNAAGDRLAIGSPGDWGGDGGNGDGMEESNYAINTGAARLFSFSDNLFSGGNLQATLGSDYVGGKNLDLRGYLDRADLLGDLFGNTVVLNGTGDRLAIGAPGDNGASNDTPDAGAVYLFSFSDNNFNGGQLQGIVGKGYTGGKNVDAATLENGDVFGAYLALNAAGDRLAVGAIGDDGSGNAVSGSGAAYLFSFSDTSFSGGTLQAILGKGYSGGKNLDVANLEAGDHFGSLAFNATGDRLAVAASLDDGSTNASIDSGAVYLYSFADNSFNSGNLEAILGKGYSGGKNVDVSLLRSEDIMGAVALNASGNLLAVGAEQHDGFTGTAFDSGAVFLYRFTDTNFSGGNLEGVIGNGYIGGKHLDTLSYGNYANLGVTVSLNAAGDRLAVGVPDDDIGGGSGDNYGSVALFSFSDTLFSSATLESRIGVGYSGGKNIDMTGRTAQGDEFGLVSLNAAGDRLAVGSWGGGGQGVHLFSFTDGNFSGGQWQAAVGAGVSGKDVNVSELQANDNFGKSVALNAVGDRLAVAAGFDDGAGNSVDGVGAVYLFSFGDANFSGGALQGIVGKGYSGGRNVDVTALEANDYFSSVALNAAGDHLAVGTQFDEGASNAVRAAGAVYLFSFSDTNFSGGTLQGIVGKGYSGIKDVDVTALEVDDQFGASVALNAAGDRLMVGALGDSGAGNAVAAAGAVYLFSFSDTNFSGGTLQGIVGKGYSGGNNVDVTALEVDDQFGGSVALNAAGDRFAVGATNDNGAGNVVGFSGAVYLFSFSDANFSGGTLQGIVGKGYSGGNNVDVTALEVGDRFGTSVALNAVGDRLAVGATGDSGAGNAFSHSGAVYQFSFSDANFSGGTLQGIVGKGYSGGNNFDVTGLQANDSFGTSVALNAVGDRLAVGAQSDDGAGNVVNNAGAVYLFSNESLSTSPGSQTYSNLPGQTVNIDRTALASLLSTGTSVTLQASNDITLEAGGGINVLNGLGDGGNLALHAGRSILLNADIVTDNGNIELIANDALANGVVDADREAGDAVISMATGTQINAGTGSINIYLTNGLGKTHTGSGDIALGPLTGSAVFIRNYGPSTGSDIVFSNNVTTFDLNAWTDFGGIVLASDAELNVLGGGTTMNLSGQTFNNAAGASALNTPNGRWLVYSGNPANDTLDGLVADFKRYNCSLNSGCLSLGTIIPVSGDGFIYSIAPVIALTADAQNKTYGAADPALTYQSSGFIDGDTVSVLTGELARPTGSLSTGGYENIGTYAINQGTVNSDLGYSFIYTGANMTVNPLTLGVSGQTVDNKVYDAGLGASTSGGTLSGVLLNDLVGFSTVAAFGTKQVGTAKTVSLDHTLSGTDAGNYTLADDTGSADITPLAINVIGISAQNKVYDGGFDAALDTTSAALSGEIGGDSVGFDLAAANGVFASKDVGTAINVAVNGLTLIGTDAGNYQLNAYTSSADITPASLAVSGLSAQNKVYDATITAQLSGTASVAAFGSDSISLSGTGVASFADKNVGSAKPVTVSGFTLTGTDAGNYNLLQPNGLSADITPASLAVSGLSAQNKVYDATITAQISGTASVAALGSDTISLSGTGVASFADKNVGSAKPVTVSGFTLTGTDAGNYSLLQPAGLSADITPTSLAVSGLSAQNKVYDATTSAQLSGTASVTALGSDNISLSGTALANFANKHVGSAKPVTVSGFTLTGSDASNYSLLQPSGLSADITPASLAVSGLSAQSKVYDATTTALLSGNGSVTALGSDTISLSGTGSASFADKHVGSAIPVTVSGFTLAGSDAGNYSLLQPSGLSADITPASLAVSGLSAQSKVYDATSTAQLSGTGSVTALGSDTISLSGTGSASFADKNVGSAKPVTVSGFTLTGTDAGNYDLQQPSGLSADITPREVFVLMIGEIGRTYDATTQANVQAGNLQLSGMLTGDNLSLTSVSASYADANVGTAKTVSASWSDSALSGADAGNYSLHNQSASADIGTITPALLTYVADPVDLLYGQAFPAFSGEVTGFVGNDTFSSATRGDLTWASAASADSSPGTYAIEGGGLDADNYLFQQASDNAQALRITPPNVPEVIENLLEIVALTDKVLTPSSDSVSSTPTSTETTETDEKSSTASEASVATASTSAPPITQDDPIVSQARSDTGLTISGNITREDFSALLQERHEFKTELFQTALEELVKDPKQAEVKVCEVGPAGDALGAKGGCMKMTSTKLGSRPNLRQPKSAAFPQIERKIALLIGINDYSQGVPKLVGAIPDVEAVSRLMESSLGYETRVLRNAGKQDIVRAMNELADDLDNNDSVTVYYAGHGYQDDETRRAYWIPRDGSARNPSNWLSSQDISRMLANLPASQVMLVSDSCFSGAFTKEQAVGGGGGGGLSGKSSGSVKGEDLLKKRSVMVMSSGGEEPVADQGRGGHSIFAWHLMETLRGFDQWAVGANLFNAVRDNVAREFPQTPHYGASLSAGHSFGGDYIFEKRSY